MSNVFVFSATASHRISCYIFSTCRKNVTMSPAGGGVGGGDTRSHKGCLSYERKPKYKYAIGKSTKQMIATSNSRPLPNPKGDTGAKQPVAVLDGLKRQTSYLALVSPLGDGRGRDAWQLTRQYNLIFPHSK